MASSANWLVEVSGQNNMRTTSILTGKDNIEHLYTTKQFPVYMGCVDTPLHKGDKKADMIFDICKDTGIIQLRCPLPLKITNFLPHNDAIGNIWKLHNEEFISFISNFDVSNILEIGGGSGKLAHLYIKHNKKCSWTVYDKNYFGKPHKNINICKTWFNSYSTLKNYDAVLHSHVLEHIHDPISFLTKIRKNVSKNTLHIFSIPNLYSWLKNKYASCLQFEHTIFLTEDIIDVILKRVGFEVVKKQKYNEHSIFYACVPARPSVVKFQNNYDEYKKMFAEFVEYYEMLINKINKQICDKQDVYLFGAHIFSQYLINKGLDISNIKYILDNSKLKKDKRLYGTNLYVKSPKILKNKKNPVVILLTGSYTQEIKEDILSNINDSVVFIP